MPWLSKRHAFVVAILAGLTACAPSQVDAPATALLAMAATDVAAIRADMATVSVSSADLRSMLGAAPAIHRWASIDVPVAIVFRPGFDAACLRQTIDRFEKAATMVTAETNLRFPRVDAPSAARILFEFTPSPTNEQAFRALSPGPDTYFTYRNPPTARGPRWEAWQLSDRGKSTIERGYGFDSRMYFANAHLQGRRAPCEAFDFAQWLKHLSWKRETPALNFVLARQYDEVQLPVYDRMLLRIVYAEGMATGVPGAAVVERLEKALR